MGLFDVLEGEAGRFNAGLAGSASPATNPAAAVAQMLQGQSGGIGEVLQKLESSGLGSLTKSWLGPGENAPVSGSQIQNALGSEPIGEVAQQLGVSHETAAGHIAQYLPLILEHLGAAGGAASADGEGLAALTSRLSGFGSQAR